MINLRLISYKCLNNLFFCFNRNLKVSATLHDRPPTDRCSFSCFYKNPYKPYIFLKLNNSILWIWTNKNDLPKCVSKLERFVSKYTSLLPPEINRRKQLPVTPHSLLNTFHQKTVSQIFDKCVCFSFISKWSWGRQLVTTPCG